jgi:hypothetical protein
LKKNVFKRIFKFRTFLLIIILIEISSFSLNSAVSQNNKREDSTIIEGKALHTAGYETYWEENGTIICSDYGSEQKNLKICSDKYGGAILVWEDTRNDNGDIYAQRIAKNGTIMWTDDGIVVCNATNSQYRPQICPDGYGGAFITWQDYRQGGPSSDIYVQRIDSDGTPQWGDYSTWGGLPDRNGTAICEANGAQQNPKICYIEYYEAIITWEDERDGNPDVYAQKIEYNGGMSWQTNGVVICNESSSQVALQICETGYPDNGAVIAWADNRSNAEGLYDIYAQLVDKDGITKWNGNGTSICNRSFSGPTYDGPIIDQDNLAICNDDNDGGAFVTWVDNRTQSPFDSNVYAQWIANNGSVMWEPNGTVICNYLNKQENPRICENDGAIIAWTDCRYGTSPYIYAQKVNLGGNTEWTPNGSVVCSDTSGGGELGGLQIYSGGNDGIFLVWHAEGGLGGYSYDIFGQQITTDGTTVWTSSSSRAQIVHTTDEQAEPQICSDLSGGIIVGWIDYRFDSEGDIYAQRISESSPSLIISDDGDDNDDNSDKTGDTFIDDLIRQGLIIPFVGALVSAVISGLVGLIFWKYKKIKDKRTPGD